MIAPIDTLTNPSQIVQIFNTNAKTLLAKLELAVTSELHTALVERFRLRINTLLYCTPSSLLTMSSPHFIKFAQEIINRDEAFFFKPQIDLYVHSTSDSYEAHSTLSLISIIRSVYSTLTIEEQNHIYTHVKTMLECCLQYYIIYPH